MENMRKNMRQPTRSDTTPARASRAAALLAAAALGAPIAAHAQAQATVKPDGLFRYAIGAGASYSSGNTDASSINIVGDAVRQTTDSKWQISGKALRGESNGVKSAENAQLTAQYDRDFTPEWFSLWKGDALRDKFANISGQVSLFGGVGRHMIKRDDLTFDLSAGLGYTYDKYVEAADVAGAFRTSYGRAEALFAEESTHKFTPTTTFHQKLSLYPALRSGGGYRGVFDSGLSVSMTPTLSLTAGFNYRYNSEPGVGLKPNDALFVTGIVVKIE